MLRPQGLLLDKREIVSEKKTLHSHTVHSILALVAQSVGQWTWNCKFAGSIPQPQSPLIYITQARD